MIHPAPEPPPEGPASTPSILDGPQLEIKVKGSRFLAQAFAADGEQAALRALDSIRRRHHDATHHCWAWRLLGDDPHRGHERSEDDGEPSGSAGVPILGALQRRKVYEALCVVTRYFGGTKLGRGGLVRAYGDAAREAVEAAPARTLWHDLVLRVDCAFEDLGTVEAQLARQAEIVRAVEREFLPGPRLHVRLRRDGAVGFAAALYELSGARIAMEFEEA
jgi:uncharacterized YigZ family protein